MVTKEVMFPYCVGMLPLSEFLGKYRAVRFCSNPSSVGRVPVMLHVSKDRVWSLRSSPNSVGMVPPALVKVEDVKLMDVTCVSAPAQVMPVIVQGLVSGEYPTVLITKKLHKMSMGYTGSDGK